MFLNNYYRMKEQNENILTDSSDFIIDKGYQVVLPNGSSVNITASAVNGFDRFSSTPSSGGIVVGATSSTTVLSRYKYIQFGSGTTPVTIYDYKCETPISNISCTSARIASITNGRRITYTFMNTNDTPITVNEVVIYDNFAFTGTACKVAVWREVFDTPLEVGAGETFIYNIEIVEV